MSNGKSFTNWNEITSEEAYRLSQAEFKGMTIQALQDLKDDIQEIKRDKEIKSYINYCISAVMGLIAGFLSSSFKH